MTAASLASNIKNIQTSKKALAAVKDAVSLRQREVGRQLTPSKLIAFIESCLHNLHYSIKDHPRFSAYRRDVLTPLIERETKEGTKKMKQEGIKQLIDDLINDSPTVLEFFKDKSNFIVFTLDDMDKDFEIMSKRRRLVSPLGGDRSGFLNWGKQIIGMLSQGDVSTGPKFRRAIAENLYESLFALHADAPFSLRRLYKEKITSKDPWTVFEAPKIPEYDKSLDISSWEALEFGMVNVSTWRAMLALAHLDQYSGKQMMVLEGPTNTGKGTILGALEEIIFSKELTSHKESFSGSSFSKESMLGKKFNLLYDTNKESLLLRGDFLSVIGGEDAVEVERKHKTSVTQTMRIFSIVATNRMLWMDNSPQLKTRVVPVLIKLEKNKEGGYIRGPQLEGDVRKQLREQLPAYMSYCIHALSKRQTKEDGSLILKKKDEELQQRLIYDFLSPISNFIHLNTKQTYNPDDMVPIPSLIALYKTSPEFSSGRADYIVASILDLFPRLSKKENHRKVLCISGLQIIGEKGEGE